MAGEGGKLRVAIVYQFWPHYRTPFLKALAADPELEVTLYGDTEDRRPRAKIPLAEVPDGIRFVPTRTWYPRGAWMWQAKMLRLAFAKFDSIVYLGDPHYPCTALSCWIARRLGKRTLMWTTGWIGTPKAGFAEKYRRAFYKLAHGLLLYGEREKEIAINLGFDPHQVYVVYNSLDLHVQEQNRRSFTNEKARQRRLELFGNDHPTLFFSGRLTKRKRLELGIRAIAELHHRGVFVNLIIVGDGPELSYYQQLAKEEGASVHFAGQVLEEESLASYYLASIGVLAPGQIGLLAMQGLAYGKRIILADDPDVTLGPEAQAVESLDQGIRFAADDLSSLVAAIEALVRAPVVDPDAVARVLHTKYNPQVQVKVLKQACRRG